MPPINPGDEEFEKTDTWWSSTGLRVAYLLAAVVLLFGSIGLYLLDRSEFSKGILFIAGPIGGVLLLLAPFWRWHHHRITDLASRIGPLVKDASRIDQLVKPPERTVILLLGVSSAMAKSLARLDRIKTTDEKARLDIPNLMEIFSASHRDDQGENIDVVFACWSPMPDPDGKDPAMDWFARRLRRVRRSNVPLHGILVYFPIDKINKKTPDLSVKRKEIELRRRQLEIIADATEVWCPCLAVFGHNPQEPAWERTTNRSDYVDFPGLDSPIAEHREAAKAVLGLLLQFSPTEAMAREQTEKRLGEFFNQTLPSFIHRRIKRRFKNTFAGEAGGTEAARFMLTDQCFAALRSAKVPETVLTALNPLKTQEFSQEYLVGEITRILNKEVRDKDEMEQFQNLILNHAQYHAQHEAAISWNRKLFLFANQWRTWWRKENIESLLNLLLVFRETEPAIAGEKTFHGCFLGSVEEGVPTSPQWVGVAPCIDKLVSLKGFATWRARPTRRIGRAVTVIGLLLIMSLGLAALLYWLFQVARPTNG